jgi:hypothetical protein
MWMDHLEVLFELIGEIMPLFLSLWVVPAVVSGSPSWSTCVSASLGGMASRWVDDLVVGDTRVSRRQEYGLFG